MGTLRLEHEWNVLAVQGCFIVDYFFRVTAGHLKRSRRGFCFTFAFSLVSQLILELCYDTFYKHCKPQGTEIYILNISYTWHVKTLRFSCAESQDRAAVHSWECREDEHLYLLWSLLPKMHKSLVYNVWSDISLGYACVSCTDSGVLDHFFPRRLDGCWLRLAAGWSSCTCHFRPL